MSDEVIYEGYIIAHAFLLGVMCGIVYGVLRIFRRIIKRGKIRAAFEDILFWIFNSAATFVFLYHVNGGVVRAYIIFFIILGMGLYEITIGNLVIKIVIKPLKFFLKIIGKLLKKIKKTFIMVLSICKLSGRGVGFENRLYRKKTKKN